VKILYLHTSPPPSVPGADAVFQEVASLQQAFGAEAANLFPLARPTVWLPPQLYGVQYLSRAADWNRRFDLFHVVHATLRPFPFLRLLRKPIVYTAAAAVQPAWELKPLPLHLVHTLVVTNERDREMMQCLGRPASVMIRPGIDTARFDAVPPPPPTTPFTLLVGSAPWTQAQFTSKGIIALLDAAAAMQDIRLVFLWRGLHRDLLQHLIAQRGLQARCDVLDGPADVPAALARCHAAVVLAATRKLVKAYPHSLLEALAAGRPIIASNTLGIADYVAQNGCGVAADGVDAKSTLASITRLRDTYPTLRDAAARLRARDFALESFIEAHRGLYDRIAHDG